MDFLLEKFINHDNPRYIIKQIHCKQLEAIRVESRTHETETIDGSSRFHVMVFTPKETTIRAAPHLCLCDECGVSYGSCDLFQDYPLVVKILKKTSLRSDIPKPVETNDNEDRELEMSDFLVPGTVCAVAADDSSNDTIWFIQIKTNEIANEEVKDDFNHVITARNSYIEGNYLERQHETKKGQYFNVMKKKSVFFFQESVVYPFVLFEEKGGKLFITNETVVDIIYYVESNGLSSI